MMIPENLRRLIEGTTRSNQEAGRLFSRDKIQFGATNLYFCLLLLFVRALSPCNAFTPRLSSLSRRHPLNMAPIQMEIEASGLGCFRFEQIPLNVPMTLRHDVSLFFYLAP